MSRTHTSAIAGKTVTLGQSDRGTGKSSRSTKPSQTLISPDEMINHLQQRFVDVVMGLKKIDRARDLDVDKLYTDLNQVIWGTEAEPTTVHVLVNDERYKPGRITGGTFSPVISLHQAKSPAHGPIGELRGGMAGVINGLFAKSLKNLGLTSELIDTFGKWQSTMLAVNDALRVLEQQSVLTELNARISQLQQETLSFTRHGQTETSAGAAPTAMLPQRNPMRGLTAAALGQELGISPVTVRKREADGELFSVLPSGRTRGRLYPELQAWSGINGDPLHAVLAALRDAGAADGSSAYIFFAGVTDLLGGLTPVEALVGQLLRHRPLDPAVSKFLGRPAPERLNSVIEAAKIHAGAAGT
jgi:hypothetical protein